jgi:hypothetical protein
MPTRPVLSVLFSAILAACGSGGDSDPQPVIGGASTGQPAPTQPAPTQPAPTQPAPTQPAPTQPAPTQPAPTGSGTPGSPSSPGAPTTAPFSAMVTKAPANNAIVISRVLLEVRGVGLENVELLPGTGYMPVYATFVISPDKTLATADVDIRLIPSGPLVVRISAFDAPAGTNNDAREIVAMAPRTWEVNNLPAHSLFFPSQACLDFIAQTNAGLPQAATSQTEENGTQRLTYTWSNGFTRVFEWQTGQGECRLVSQSGTPP